MVKRPLADEFKDTQVNVYATHDDTILIGPPAHLVAASKRLQELAGACGLRYGDAKCKLYQRPLPPLGHLASPVRTYQPPALRRPRRPSTAAPLRP